MEERGSRGHASESQGVDKSPATPGAVQVLGPFAVTALAAGLWWLSDRLGGIGPLDRATFGWFIVIPVWFAAPVVAGFVWRGLGRREIAATAAVLATLEGAMVAAWFWNAAAFPACDTAPVRSPVEWILPSLLLGLVVGGGLAVSGVVCAGRMRTGHRRAGIIVAMSVQAGVTALAAIILIAMLLGGGCQRPAS